MRLDIFNIDDFVRDNHCKEVTNPVFFNFDTTPTEDGLFSNEIFGLSDEERKNTFAYIDLHDNFIHPLVWAIITGRMGSIKDVLLGNKYAVIADKKIKIVPEDFVGAETGIDFLYDHFSEINWIDEIEADEIDSLDKKTRLKFLKSLKKDEFFVRKWLVLPPYYRAESSTNRSMGDSINKLYKELISKTKSLKTGFSFSLFGAQTKLRIQSLLKDIYLSTTTPVSGKNLILEKGKTEGTLKGSGKNSMIRGHLLGKTIDWTASSVITAPNNSTAVKFEQKPVPFGSCAFPMATLLSLFAPFFISTSMQVLESYLNSFANEYANDIKKINVGQFDNEAIQKMIKEFIKTPTERFIPIKFNYINKSNTKVEKIAMMYEFNNKSDADKGVNYIERPFTLSDLLYLVAVEVLSDKHVYVTRYPVADIQNIAPAKVKILTTVKTRDVYIKLVKDSVSQHYPDYPSVYVPGGNVSKRDSTFYDVLLVGNAYLDSMGADYDGDMLYLKPVFSKEANAEAERLIWKKTNFFQAAGELSRGIGHIGKGAIIGLYEISKDAE